MTQPGGEIDRTLLEILVCPVIKGPLTYDPGPQALLSEQAGLVYPIRSAVSPASKRKARAEAGLQGQHWLVGRRRITRPWISKHSQDSLIFKRSEEHTSELQS